MKTLIARSMLSLTAVVLALTAVAAGIRHDAAADHGQWLALCGGGDDHAGCLHTPLLAACTLPGASPRIQEAIAQHMWQTYFETHPEAGGVAYFLAPRWTPGSQGDPITLRWSVVPDGLFIPSGIGEPSGASILRARLIQIFGTLDAGLQRFRLVFDRWEALTGIDFVEVGDDGAMWGAPGSTSRGDIRIGMHNFGFTTTLAYAGFPNGGDIVFNGSADFDFALSNYRFLRNTLAHESGHATGLMHSCPQIDTKLMEPNISIAYDGPQHDDIRGNQRHYGDRLENNNGVLAAVDLGTQTDVDLNDLSIDASNDIDYFKFTVSQPNMAVTVRAMPIGMVYQMVAQPSGDPCPAEGPAINSIAVFNLNIRLLDGSFAVLIDDDSSGIGFTEHLVNYPLPGPDTYYIRVGTVTSGADIQLYNLQVDVTSLGPPPCPADLDGSSSVNGLDIAIALGQWTGAASYSPCPPYRTADLNQDCKVNGLDLAQLLGAWGACP